MILTERMKKNRQIPEEDGKILFSNLSNGALCVILEDKVTVMMVPEYAVTRTPYKTNFPV
jgi:hypothetical protein